MKAFFSAYLILISSCSCAAMKLDFPEDSSSYSSQPLLQPPLDRIEPIVSGLFATNIENDALNVFVLPVEQGSFNVIRCNNCIIIVDIGSLKGSADEFFDLHNQEISAIFDNATLTGVVVTHPDIDHYMWLKYLVEREIVQIKDGIRVFVGGGSCLVFLNSTFPVQTKIDKCLIYLKSTLQEYNPALYINKMNLENFQGRAIWVNEERELSYEETERLLEGCLEDKCKIEFFGSFTR